MPRKKKVEVSQKKQEVIKKDSENSLEKKSDGKKELKIILFGMVALLAIFLIFYYIFSGINNFNYKGLDFTKERFGDIPVYHYYKYDRNLQTGELIKYNLYLRLDPRENDVPVEGEIEFQQGQHTYLSVDSFGLSKCEDASLGVASLSAFLVNNQIMVKGASPNYIQAESSNVEYAKCGEPADRFVILFELGNETKIVREDMCYRVTVSNCEVLEAAEKFEVQALLDAKERSLD